MNAKTTHVRITADNQVQIAPYINYHLLPPAEYVSGLISDMVAACAMLGHHVDVAVNSARVAELMKRPHYRRFYQPDDSGGFEDHVTLLNSGRLWLTVTKKFWEGKYDSPAGINFTCPMFPLTPDEAATMTRGLAEAAAVVAAMDAKAATK